MRPGNYICQSATDANYTVLQQISRAGLTLDSVGHASGFGRRSMRRLMQARMRRGR